MKDSLGNLREIRHATLSSAAILSLANLSPDVFPPIWLAVFVMPAVLLHGLRRSRVLGPRTSLAFIALVQLGAIIATANWYQPLDRLGALGCTLVPPMVYLTMRAEGVDVLRALFLAFCLFLIGSILDSVSEILSIAFAVSSLMTLHFDTSVGQAEQRYSWRSETLSMGRRLRGVMRNTAAGVAIVLLTFQLLALIPSPNQEPQKKPAKSPSGSTSVGLNDQFNFQSAAGGLLNIRADRVLRVVSADEYPLPADLYLRTKYFDVATLNGWRTTGASVRRAPSDPWTVGPRSRSRPLRKIGVEILEPSLWAFVPPGAVQIFNSGQILGSPLYARFEYRSPPPVATRYQVSYQNHHHSWPDALPPPGFESLTRVGVTIRENSTLFYEVLEEADVGSTVDPMEIASRVAEVLQSRCEYSLAEPTGAYQHSLLNFLDGNRRGFCMHFAAVTAICLRLVGVPCRIGAGLLGGDPGDEPGERYFGSQHAHAWVEIPIEDHGWVVFDPTPPAARENPRWPTMEDVDESGVEQEETTEALVDRFARSLLQPLANPWPWVITIAIVVFLASVQRRRVGELTERTKPSPDSVTARRLLDKLLKRLEQIGVTRRRGETLEHLAIRLEHQQVDPTDRIRDGLAAYQEVRFGERTFSGDCRDRLEAALDAARESQRSTTNPSDSSDASISAT